MRRLLNVMRSLQVSLFQNRNAVCGMAGNDVGNRAHGKQIDARDGGTNPGLLLVMEVFCRQVVEKGQRCPAHREKLRDMISPIKLIRTRSGDANFLVITGKVLCKTTCEPKRAK